MNFIEARIQIKSLLTDESKAIRDASSRLDFSLDMMLRFEAAGRFTEAKRIAQISCNDVKILEIVVESEDAVNALATIRVTIANVSTLPDTGPTLTEQLSDFAAKYREGPELFRVGTYVKIRTLKELEAFVRDWKYHHPLSPEQLEFAGMVCRVRRVDYYGGDSLYYFDETGPFIWQDECLTAVKP